ncbi:GumC family protein [Amorphus coralli]|uniref:GumC family protein n=1 Tax=Amorphus coralli TaxID=340680 RepID=UPI00037CE04B|nr:polysaccharide biosynthesis tyrosine autokinase [Amorphus coralli]
MDEGSDKRREARPAAERWSDGDGGMSNPILWLVRVLRQRLFLIVAIVVLGVAASVAFALSLPPNYRASALVEIDPQAEQVLENTAPQRASPFPDVIAETEVQVIGSEAILARAITELDLQYYPAINPTLKQPGGLLSRILPASTEDRPTNPVQLETQMVRALRNNLSVSRVGQSNVVRVSFESQSPRLSADIANGIVAVYLEDEIARSRDLSQNALDLLGERVANLRREVEEREQAVEQWRRESGISEGVSSTVLRERITQLSGELSRAQAALAEARAVSQNVDASARFDGTDPQVVGSRLIQNLSEREADQEQEVSRLEALYQPSHPRLIAARASLQSLRDAIETETRKISSSLGRSERIQSERVRELQADVEELRQELDGQREAEIRLRALEQEAEASRGVYESFLARQNELQNRMGLERARARVVARATPPLDPSGPNRKLIVAGGLFASSFFAVALAILLAQLQPAVRVAEDVEDVLGVPPLAEVPWLSGREGSPFAPVERVVEAPEGQLAEAIRALRVSLLIGRAHDRATIVMVASGEDGEGKTSVAAALARAAAQAGDRVLLIDCDLDRPTIHTIFGGNDRIGIANVLLDRADSESAIQIDGVSSALFMSCGLTGSGDSEIYRSLNWEDLLAALSGHLDLIILDTPSLARVPDARFLAGVVDATLVVALARSTSREALRETVRFCQIPGGSAETAIVLNGVETGERLTFGNRRV